MFRISDGYEYVSHLFYSRLCEVHTHRGGCEFYNGFKVLTNYYYGSKVTEPHRFAGRTYFFR